jgi:hypothetical protein
VLSVSLLLAGVGTAAAQTIATAAANVPVYVTTGSATPIRVASAGTKFTVIEDNGSEWVRVAFSDPVLGRRVGFVQRGGLELGTHGFVTKAAALTVAGTPGKPNCHGQSVSALAEQFGDLDAAAAALGFPGVQALQHAIQAFCKR